MSLNYNGLITYEDFVISEDEHKEYDDDNDTDSSSHSDYDNDSDNDTDNDIVDTLEDLNINEIETNEEQLSSEKKDDISKSIVSETEDKQEIKQELLQNITNAKEKKERKPRKKIEKCECGICADVYNVSNRKEIKCLFCNYSACRSCYEQYLLQSNENICMNCKTVWNREFLDNNFTKVFMKGKYKKRREDVLMDKQKALLQATIPIAEIRNNASLRLEIIRKRKYELCQYIKTLENELRDIDNETYTLRGQLTSKKVNDTQKRHFIKKCPNSECRGFLSTRWKCGLCNTDVCSECHEIKTNEENNQHVCKPENVETAKLIAKDCKNCPKCGTYIYKINGCFAKDTEIPLWNGSIKKVQDIVVGDELIGDDGTKRIVLNTFNGEDQLYEIQQNKGISYIVNSKHTLILKYRNDTTYIENLKSSDYIEIKVDDYLKLEYKHKK